MNHARSNPEGIVRAAFEALDVSASNKCSGRKGRREMERQDGRETEGEGGRDSKRERETDRRKRNAIVCHCFRLLSAIAKAREPRRGSDACMQQI